MADQVSLNIKLNDIRFTLRSIGFLIESIESGTLPDSYALLDLDNISEKLLEARNMVVEAKVYAGPSISQEGYEGF